MREAVIVSTARTPIGKAYRGAFNNTEAPTLGGHAVKHAVERAGLDPAEVEDVMMGCAMPQGTQGQNVGRQIALAAGLSVSTAGMTVDRQCSSGMMAIALAAKSVIVDNVDIMVGGGLESISLVQNEHQNTYRAADPRLLAVHADVLMPMIDTAEVVSRRYKVSREAQDEYALQSQQRTAAGQEAGKFDDEIVPLPSNMGVLDKETKEISFHDIVLEKDEGNRPTTTLDGLAGLKPVRENGFITAG
ncbi:MAG: acetyl-CoA C-acyltransferase, partial [Gammaproteobacteria bacterium]|nr:acetyl-CoA C-acyltransferase [Gammaproteobacteria bacterium]